MPRAETLLDQMKAMAARENAVARRVWGTSTWHAGAGESPAKRDARLAKSRAKREARQDLCLQLKEGGRTVAAIAELLGMPPQTVKGYIFDARKRRDRGA